MTAHHWPPPPQPRVMAEVRYVAKHYGLAFRPFTESGPIVVPLSALTIRKVTHA